MQRRVGILGVGFRVLEDNRTPPIFFQAHRSRRVGAEMYRAGRLFIGNLPSVRIRHHRGQLEHSSAIFGHWLFIKKMAPVHK